MARGRERTLESKRSFPLAAPDEAQPERKPSMSFLGGNSFKPGSRGSDENGSRRERGVDREADQLYAGEATKLLTKMPAEEEAPSYIADAPTFSKATATPPDKCTNIIANGAKWQGTLKVDDSVRIDGTFSGEVQTKGTVHVSEGAQVDAKIKASFVVIGGNFRGEIRCDTRTDLLPRSRTNGEIITKILNVHEGAIVDGRIQMSNEGEVAASSSRTSRSSTRGTGSAAHEEIRETNGVHA